jgi:hypothetical protein
MNTQTAGTYVIRLYLSGPIETAKQIIRSHVLTVGLCVTVEPTTFIYTGGEEAGYVVGLLNYPRFPTSPDEILAKARALMLALLDGTFQHSALLVAPDVTEWMTKRAVASPNSVSGPAEPTPLANRGETDGTSADLDRVFAYARKECWPDERYIVDRAESYVNSLKALVGTLWDALPSRDPAAPAVSSGPERVGEDGVRWEVWTREDHEAMPSVAIVQGSEAGARAFCEKWKDDYKPGDIFLVRATTTRHRVSDDA